MYAFVTDVQQEGDNDIGNIEPRQRHDRPRVATVAKRTAPLRHVAGAAGAKRNRQAQPMSLAVYSPNINRKRCEEFARLTALFDLAGSNAVTKASSPPEIRGFENQNAGRLRRARAATHSYL